MSVHENILLLNFDVFLGSRVYRHCTEFTSVTCMQCTGNTYTDEPNGLLSCISCTVCDAGKSVLRNVLKWKFI